MLRAAEAIRGAPPPEAEEIPFLHELFHALNQPLTTLRCALELAIIQPRTTEQLHRELEVALERAEEVALLATGIQHLLAAEEPGTAPMELDLRKFVQEAAAEWGPVAASTSAEIDVKCDASEIVIFDARQLAHALFRLMDFVVASCVFGVRGHIELGDDEQGELRAVLSVLFTGLQGARAAECKSFSLHPWPEKSDKKQQLVSTLALQIAKRIFVAAGGDFQSGRAGDSAWLQVRLPKIAHTTRAPMPSAKKKHAKLAQ